MAKQSRRAQVSHSNEGHEILGSVFSGVMLISIASIFMSKVKSNNNEKTPQGRR